MDNSEAILFLKSLQEATDATGTREAVAGFDRLTDQFDFNVEYSCRPGPFPVACQRWQIETLS